MPRNITVRHQRHPLSLEMVPRQYTRRVSIGRLVEDSKLPPKDAIVEMNGKRIEHIYWEVCPKDGARIRITAPPRGGGGGKNIFRTILTLAVVVGSLFAGPAIAGALGLAGLGGIFSGVVSGLGLLLVNSLLPPARPETPQLTNQGLDSSIQGGSNFIQGSRNELRPFQAIPKNFGVNEYAPPYGAPPYSIAQGSKNSFVQLFVVSTGKNVITKKKIGTDLLSTFTDFRSFETPGNKANERLRGYPTSVVPRSFSVRFKLVDDWIERNVPADADRIGVEISFPQLFRIDPQTGKQRVTDVGVQVQYRLQAGGGWQSLPATVDTSFPKAWRSGDVITFQANTNTRITHALYFDVPDLDKYAIRVRRRQTDKEDRMGENANRFFDDSFLTAVIAFRDQDSIDYPVSPLTKVSLRIGATEQLNGVVDEFTCRASSVALDWNGSAWVERETANPASMAREFLQDSENSERLINAQLDLPSFQAFHDWCETNNFTFNKVQETFINADDLLAQILASGRGFKRIVGSKVGIGIDWIRESVTTVTPLKSSNFLYERPLIDLPHAFEARFRNRGKDFESDYVRVYAPGFNVTNATRIESREYPGVTSSFHLRKLLTVDMNEVYQRPERFTFEIGWEYLPLEAGERINVSHDVIDRGRAWGLVKTLIIAGDNITAIELDVPAPCVAGENYSLLLALPSLNVEDRTITVAVDNPGTGDFSTFTLTTPFDTTTVSRVPMAGDAVVFGTTGNLVEDLIILQIQASEGERARLVCTSYKGDLIYRFSNVSPVDPPSTIPERFTLKAPVVREILSDETVLTVNAAGDGVQEQVSIVVDPVLEFFTDAFLVVQGSPIEAQGDYQPLPSTTVTENHVILTGPFQTGQVWDFRLRWFNPAGIRKQTRISPWKTVRHTIVGRSTPPVAPINLRAEYINEQMVFCWDTPPELDVRFGGRVFFRYSTDTAAPYSATAAVGSAPARDLKASFGPIAGIVYAYVRDSYLVRSPVESVIAEQVSHLPFGTATVATEHPTFAGTKTDLTVETSRLKLAGLGDFDSIPDFDAVPDVDAYGGLATEGTYEFANLISFPDVQPTRLTRLLKSIEVDNTAATIDARDGLVDDWPDWDGAVADSSDVEFYVRTTTDDPAASPTWSDWVFLSTSATFNMRGAQGRLIVKTDSQDYNREVIEAGLIADRT